MRTAALVLLFAACLIGQNQGQYSHLGAASHIPGRGLIADYRLIANNLTLYSEDFTNAAWVKGGTAAASDATTISLPAEGDSVTQAVAQALAISGRAYVAGIVLSGTPGQTVTLRICGATTTADKADTVITLAATPTLYKVSRTFLIATTDTSLNVTLLRDTGQTAATVTAAQAQLSERTMFVDKAALPAYERTTDLQVWPNYADARYPIRRGSTTGVDADDPTVTAEGWWLQYTANQFGGTALSFPSDISLIAIMRSTRESALVGSSGGVKSFEWIISGGYAAYYSDINGGAVRFRGGNPVGRYSLPPAGTFGVVGMTFRSDTYESNAYVDGEWRDYAMGNIPITCPGKILLGKYYVSSHAMLGQIVRVLIYNRYLGDAEMRAAHVALKDWAAEHGVQVP